MTLADDSLVGLLVETREEINRADSKANFLLTGAGLAVAALVAGLVSGDLDPTDARGVVQVLVIASCCLLALGLYAVGAAVFPHTGTPAPGHARYFMEIAQFDTVNALDGALSDENLDPRARCLQQVLVLSKAVSRKYRWIRAGEVLLGLGIVAAAGAGLVHAALG